MDLTITVHHYIHHADAERETQRKLDDLLAQGERQMASNERIEQALGDVDTRLTDLETVVSKVAGDDAAEDAAFQAEIDRLKAALAAAGVSEQVNLDTVASLFASRGKRVQTITDALKSTLPPAPAEAPA